MNRHLNFRQALLFTAISITLLIGPMACKSQKQDLSFKTISQGTSFQTGRNYSGKDPNFLIITKPEDVDAPGLEVQFPPELDAQLRSIDYQHSFVVVVFRGISGGSPKFAVDVLRLSRSDSQVILQARLKSPGIGDRVYDILSSPYLAVEVEKENEWKAQIRFTLIIDDKLVADTSHFIP